MTQAELIQEMREDLPNGHAIDESRLESCLRKATRRIFNYCNIEALPAALEDVAIEMGCAYYRKWAVENGIMSARVASLKEADRSISYASSTTEFDAALIMGYSEQLNRHRRMGVVRSG